MYPSDVNDVFRASRVAASGLKSNRSWMTMIANNISNANTLDTGVRDRSGNFVPYARQVPIFSKILSEKFRENRVNSDVANGVRVKEIKELKGNVKKVYNPSHPAARKAGTQDAGYVYYPSVSTSQEMADLRIAAAAYEANLSVITIASKMNQQALSLGRGG
ncbi:Flagellar basal-body rod protein FlgC [Chlamydiales bacterium SCGC AG-110-M15]|nr:Flagellar basal-body rod protein FlgC [Chlamydiales bacterium SCGC AG-110-M15]